MAMVKKRVIIAAFLFVYHLLTVSANEGGGEEEVGTKKVFAPSDEWQEILPDQKVPAGLHYRIDLKSGKKEAKYLVAEDRKSNGAIISVPTKEDHHNSSSSSKPQLDKLKLRMNSDVEHIEVLMAHFANSSATVKVAILEDLDYYMHQIDNARDFVTLGGLEKVVKLAMMDDEMPEVVEMATMLVGSASQNNPPVQDAFTSRGMMSIIVGNLIKTDNENVARRCIYALSSLIRGNNNSLNVFLELRTGLDYILNRLSSEDDGYDQRSFSLKMLTFLSDLLQEDSDLVSYALNRAMPLWCKTLTSDSRLFHVTTLLNFDRIEKLVDILLTFVRPCGYSTINDSSIIRKWLKQAENVVKSVMTEADDDFVTDVNETLNKIRTLISGLNGSNIDKIEL